MSSNPGCYIIVGNGRWGSRMHSMLLAERRRAVIAPSMRPQPGEPDRDYEARLAHQFVRSEAQIAWLCVPPGPHVPLMLGAALSAGLNVIVEKPWLYPSAHTARLHEAAEKMNLTIGVHFEYCLLSEVEHWRGEYETGDGLGFSGIFDVRTGNHLGVPALQNLGSHLVAMHNYAVPAAKLSSIRCNYASEDQRLVWLESRGERIAAIDFLGSKEPIVQRFTQRFESSLNRKYHFPFDLKFASDVAQRLAKLETS